MNRPTKVFALRAAAAAVLGAFASGATAQTDVQTGLERALKTPVEIVWLRGEVRSEAWAGNPRPGVALQDCSKAGSPSQGCAVSWRPPTCFLLSPGAPSDQACVSLSVLKGADSRFVAGQRRISGSGVYLLAADTGDGDARPAPSGQVMLAAGTSAYLVDAAYQGIVVEVRAPAQQPMLLGNLAAMDIGKIFALLLKQPASSGKSEAMPVRVEPIQVAALESRIESPAVLVEVAMLAPAPAEPKLETPAVLVEVAMLASAPAEPKLDTPAVLIEVASLVPAPAEPKLETPAALVEVATPVKLAAAAPAPVAVPVHKASSDDVARMRAEVEAEIGRDRERVAQSMQSRAPARRFVLGS